MADAPPPLINAPLRYKCTGNCKQLLPRAEFKINQKSGQPFKQCKNCSQRRTATRHAREGKPSPAELPTLDDYLIQLRGQKAAGKGLDLKIRVQLPNQTLANDTSIRSEADAIAKKVWDVTGFRWV